MNQNVRILQPAASRGSRPSAPLFAMKSLAAATMPAVRQPRSMPCRPVARSLTAAPASIRQRRSDDHHPTKPERHHQLAGLQHRARARSVTFVQPNSQSVALNRVLGADPSSDLRQPERQRQGVPDQSRTACCSATAPRSMSAAWWPPPGYHRRRFHGRSPSHVHRRRRGAGERSDSAINADGGYVALIGANVVNDGVISARLGTVALAAGEAMTLDVAGDGLLNVRVDRGWSMRWCRTAA